MRSLGFGLAPPPRRPTVARRLGRRRRRVALLALSFSCRRLPARRLSYFFFCPRPRARPPAPAWGSYSPCRCARGTAPRPPLPRGLSSSLPALCGLLHSPLYVSSFSVGPSPPRRPTGDARHRAPRFCVFGLPPGGQRQRRWRRPGNPADCATRFRTVTRAGCEAAPTRYPFPYSGPPRPPRGGPATLTSRARNLSFSLPARFCLRRGPHAPLRSASRRRHR